MAKSTSSGSVDKPKRKNLNKRGKKSVTKQEAVSTQEQEQEQEQEHYHHNHHHHHHHHPGKCKRSIFADSPVYNLLHYFEKAPDQWAARYILILSSVLLQTAVGLGGHSGKGTPPMYGDFEAQRHWMEITNYLPISQWYFFDLAYWGLDYPPLTAYHSWFLGKIGNFINSAWFHLNSSRGMESQGLIFFLRLTSIISELMIYIPAVLLLAHILGGKRYNLSRMDQIIIALIIVSQPGLTLIDHGHFQYNSVMLGLFLYSVIDLIHNNLVLASIWFVSCINFKQMGLYYSIFIFFYILSQLNHFQDLIAVGATVVVTQLIYLLPFLLSNHPIKTLQQILIRVFPFNRGLFEDKVANFWCTTNIFIKYRELFNDSSQLARLTSITTLSVILPINIYIFLKVKKAASSKSKSNIHKLKAPAIIYGFAYNALSFYLFSYQVHEKSILVALCPILLLLFIDPGDITMIQWINNIGTFSMYPLLYKDGLVLQYFVTQFLINWLIGFKLIIPKGWRHLNSIVIWCTYLGMMAYHAIDFMIPPPARYPDLWVILNTAISFVAFGYFWLWLIYRIYRL
ncbi:ALG6 [Candida oxycetoniae]|uniref:Alpha-1,3-glucosyltransferase n=1 Tax=Candida oxycetoniae TaxID=497107 RepID=A0AAI9WYN4_9ASCO|nr:ALG6 [Candida oxycetoniae]KAI3405228.2 ALG6 [Candida oxycetoniae]